MGYVVVVGSCWSCGTIFSFNPMKVPSIRIEGVREPVCENCIKKANIIRRQQGMPEIVVQPGAYDACNENELGD